jgi:hypothetical protein
MVELQNNSCFKLIRVCIIIPKLILFLFKRNISKEPIISRSSQYGKKKKDLYILFVSFYKQESNKIMLLNHKKRTSS